MNQSQKNYAMSRVNQIEAAHAAAIKAKHTKPGVELSFEQKVTLIRGSKVKLKATVRDHHYLTSAFDFSKFEKNEVVNQTAIDADTKKLRAQANAVRDEIMLGDEIAAKRLIETFAKSFA